MIKWKKMSAVILVSSMLVPIVPYQVFSEEIDNNSSSDISEQKESELNDNLHTSINEINRYMIDHSSQEISEIDSFDFDQQRYFIEDEANIDDQIFVRVSDGIDEIGWVKLISLEDKDFELIDLREDEDLQKDSDSHTTQETVKDDETNPDSELALQESTEADSLQEDSLKDTPVLTNEQQADSKTTAAAQDIKTSSSSNSLSVLSTKDVSYAADITKPWSINTLPWGTKGAQLVESAEKHIGNTVVVSQEKVTQRSTYALITYGDQELGWIDITGIQKHSILETKSTDYTVEVTKPWSVNTQPWGTNGYIPVNNESLVGNEYEVRKEAITQRSTYVLLTKDGKDIGWIDSTGVQERLPALSEKNVNYTAKIVKPWSVNSRPWGTTGSKKVIADGALLGDRVTVNKEITTPKATYASISIDGEQIGWVDKITLNILTVTQYKDVNYSIAITKPWSINTLPWGVEGYRTVETSAQVGSGYTVVKEAETARSTYVLLEKNSSEIGWIDVTGVQKVTAIKSSRNTNYVAEVTKPWSINTNPHDTIGAQWIMSARDIIGENVTVSMEKKTDSDTYAYISLGNKEIGWINKTGLAPLEVISEKTVNYDVSITKPWSVNTLPWGVEGYAKVLDGISIVGNDYRVLKESKTSRGMYVLLTDGNKEIGWIDSTGVEKYMMVSSSNKVNYTAKIIHPWSINSEPYGTKGAIRILNDKDYYGKTVNVIEEKTTERSTYALIQFDGLVVGWIDKNALDARRVVMLDPGHGGSDPGAYGILNGRRINEKDLNLSVSLKLRKILQSQGYTVLMTRDNDSTVRALDRGRITNASNADIFLSIHFNAMPKTLANYSRVNGIESFFYKYNPDYPSKLIPKTHDNPYKLAEGYKLAHDIQDGLLAETGARHRRVDDAAFIVIKEVEVPAALTELGFLTNQQDLSKAVTDSYQNKLAKGLANGINKYFYK